MSAFDLALLRIGFLQGGYAASTRNSKIYAFVTVGAFKCVNSSTMSSPRSDSYYLAHISL